MFFFTASEFESAKRFFLNFLILIRNVNSYKQLCNKNKIIKAFKILKLSINPTKDDFAVVQVVLDFNFLFTYSPSLDCQVCYIFNTN